MSGDNNAEADVTRANSARAYIHALLTHDISEVRLDPECTRIELGVKTGRSGAHIERSLARGPQYRLIHQISDLELEVDGPRVTTRYYVHVRPKALRLAALVKETFVIDEDGNIRSIVARFGAPRRTSI